MEGEEEKGDFNYIIILDKLIEAGQGEREYCAESQKPS